MMKILIVDDDIATVEVIRDSVDWGKLGIDEIHTAHNVVSAKKKLQEFSIDIIVSDIEMPQESGIDFLKWIRKEQGEYEFLFLTCHESFTYATDAISYNAAAYIIKPFDINIMEMTLQKIVMKIIQKREMKKSSEYGIWMEKNHRHMKLGFWKSILDGEITDQSKAKNEITSRHLDIEYLKEYYLVCSKLNNTEADIEKYGKDVFEFVLEGFHSELLTGNVVNETVVKCYHGETLWFLAICKDGDELKEKCYHLINTSKEYFKCTMTCCIGNPCKITELYQRKKILERLFDYNINNFGKVFYENEVESSIDNNLQILDIEQLMNMVEQKNKSQILHYLKRVFDELAVCKKLNVHTLYLMKQEIIQVVYTDLMKLGIQATKLFYDEFSIKVEERALESTVDMVRWVNYLLEKTFAYEEEVAQNTSLIDKINEYIHNHYAENIGRSKIAGEFFLTPEYLAKLYKRKTGVNLKDYINEYRIKKAKEYLISTNLTISDVAEAVGFDNFSYFSTLFKKITSITPKDYKNRPQNQKE